MVREICLEMVGYAFVESTSNTDNRCELMSSLSSEQLCS